MAVTRDTLERAGRVPGAYALLIRLDEPLRFFRPAVGQAELNDTLIYLGSARGPGGMQARLSRHFRRSKTVRWHVDELTNAAAELSALAIAEGMECDLVSTLTQSGQFVPAMSGFGSSDCRQCVAHLLKPSGLAC